MTVFVDTSYWLALEIADEQYHPVALSHWQRMNTALPTLVTTSYVFDEVVTFLNTRGLHKKAVQIGSTLLNSPSFRSVDSR